MADHPAAKSVIIIQVAVTRQAHMAHILLVGGNIVLYRTHKSI